MPVRYLAAAQKASHGVSSAPVRLGRWVVRCQARSQQGPRAEGPRVHPLRYVLQIENYSLSIVAVRCRWVLSGVSPLLRCCSVFGKEHDGLQGSIPIRKQNLRQYRTACVRCKMASGPYHAYKKIKIKCCIWSQAGTSSRDKGWFSHLDEDAISFLFAL